MTALHTQQFPVLESAPVTAVQSGESQIQEIGEGVCLSLHSHQFRWITKATAFSKTQDLQSVNTDFKTEMYWRVFGYGKNHQRPIQPPSMVMISPFM